MLTFTGQETIMASYLLPVAAIVACAVALVWALLRAHYSAQLSVLKERLDQQGRILSSAQLSQKQTQSEKDILLQRVTRSDTELGLVQEQQAQLIRCQQENTGLRDELAQLRARLQAAEEKWLEQRKELDHLGAAFRMEFQHLAQTILDEKSEKFNRLSEEKIGAILSPLKTQLSEFRQKVEESYDKESKERFSLGRELQRLMEMSQQVSQDAHNLTSALKGNNKMQGNWGEMILESLLETCGLQKGREYFSQEFLRDRSGQIILDEQGKGLQPDILICYPDQRRLVIDSKVSLLAWEQYVSAEEPADRDASLKNHISSLRTHIDELSHKNYSRYAEALNYTLLFIPIEPAFLEAVRSDRQLWKFAYDRRILLVSPTNLFAVLRIVSELWKMEKQNKHAIEIATRAGRLYDKFVQFVENLETVGKKLDEAGLAYGQAFKQLSTGKGNLVHRAEELKKIGASAEKQLPDRLLIDASAE
jgi:DNA recombination protein RmuC